MGLIPPAPRDWLRRYLAALADKIEARGREYQSAAERQFHDALILRQLADQEVPETVAVVA
jgi:hypothetical protein